MIGQMNSHAKEAVKAALDELALALTDRGHKWTPAQRHLYDQAIRLLD